MISRLVLWITLLTTLPVCPGYQTSPPKADLVLRNGRIWTGTADGPWAQALAIRGNVISGVGSEAAIRNQIGEKTKVIDLQERLASAGFNDAHTHFLSGALGLSEVDLTGAASLEAVQQRVAQFAGTHPAESWITGAGWEYSIFPGKRLPTRSDLDAVVRDRPVFLRAYDGHTGWANSRAMEVAGVTSKSSFKGYGEMALDSNTGEPTGIFKEGAQSLIRKAIPAPSRDKKLASLRKALQMAASLGITSFQNAGGDMEDLSLYEELIKGNELTARVALALSVGSKTTVEDLDRIAALKMKYPGPLLRIGSVKIMLDGVIESHTAAMLAPYSDLPGTSGSASFSQDDLDRLVLQSDKAGLQVLTHAIGDRAVRMALNAYEHAVHVNGSHDARFRIEHIETIAASDIGRFARLGVLASMEPIHADPGTNEVWVPAVGDERSRRAFAWRSLEKAGALLVFSSDWPATISVDPIRGIHNAVNRRTIHGQPPGGWLPDQRVSLATALRAYTSSGAIASFEEKIKGTLAEGMLADIVVFSQDLFRIDPMEIHKTRVELTIFDGRVIYERDR